MTFLKLLLIIDVVDAEKRFEETKKKINQLLEKTASGDNGGDSYVNDFSIDRIKQAIRNAEQMFDTDKLLSDVADEAKYMGDSQFTKAVNEMMQEMTQGMTEDEKSEVR